MLASTRAISMTATALATMPMPCGRRRYFEVCAYVCVWCVCVCLCVCMCVCAHVCVYHARQLKLCLMAGCPGLQLVQGAQIAQEGMTSVGAQLWLKPAQLPP